jgi:hypothetical protein
MAENSIPDNAAETWYNERQARLGSECARIEAQEIAMQNSYTNLENRWAELDRQEDDAHTMLETRDLVRILDEKQRLKAEAGQLQSGWSALQQEKQQIERLSNLDYNSLHDNSSEKSKLFLQVFKSKLENDPATVRRLIYADSQVRAAGIPADTNEYFASLEEHMGFKPEERRFEFEDRPSTAKRKQAAQQKVSPEQIEFSQTIQGLDPKEYLAAAANPFSSAASESVTVDPGELVDTGKTQDGSDLEIRMTKPKPAEVKLPQGDKWSNSTVTLSPEQVDLARQQATVTNRPFNEVLREHAEMQLLLDRGETSYKLSAEKQRQSTPTKHF